MGRLLQTYTLRNIRNEIVHRVNTWKARTQATSDPRGSEPAYDDTHALSVGRFYDTHHQSFMRVYGDVIQALRTRDVTTLLDHQIRTIGLQAGQHVLDAGCGVAAPAIYFARHAGVRVDAITISHAQHEAARRNVAAAGLPDYVNVVHGDYHRLPEYFPAGAYDVIYFLESFGHSRAKTRLIDRCWTMLKPGGLLYIKDLFVRVPLRPEHAAPIEAQVRRINDAYHYEIADLNRLIDDVRGRGFYLSSVRSVELDLEAFENLAISNEFQELTGIARIDDWNAYVFPVDFFEICCRKPLFRIDQRLDRHYLQNLHHLRATDTPPEPTPSAP
jgi:cyclopropane fatty-acyl-phospholipid synthase-like methyltransferase